MPPHHEAASLGTRWLCHVLQAAGAVAIPSAHFPARGLRFSLDELRRAGPADGGNISESGRRRRFEMGDNSLIICHAMQKPTFHLVASMAVQISSQLGGTKKLGIGSQIKKKGQS